MLKRCSCDAALATVPNPPKKLIKPPPLASRVGKRDVVMGRVVVTVHCHCRSSF